MVSSEYLNLKEAARYLSVSDIKIRRLIRKGLLKVSLDPLDDRKRLVKKTDLDALKTPRPATSRRQSEGLGQFGQRKEDTSNPNRGSAPNEP